MHELVRWRLKVGPGSPSKAKETVRKVWQERGRKGKGGDGRKGWEKREGAQR